ncbi:MAG: quinone-dependent dihydroorotate dehydrogenase [Polyangiales bacterium]
MTDPLGALYRRALRPALFHLDAETAHGLAASGLRLAHRWAPLRAVTRALLSPDDDPILAVRVWGKDFRSPIGVAGGFDKSATLYNGLGALGFAHVEVGTVTSRAQPGNPRPRLFRLPLDRAVVNRMGFNNPGAAAAREALAAVRADRVRVGVNLGKSKVTPLEDAPADYAESARLLAPLADWMVVNVSSPNTPGLRSLQSVDALVDVVRAVRAAVSEGPGAATPLLVKIAPDLADEDIDAVVELARAERLDGVVATNTTTRREGLRTPESVVRAAGDGGLSGAPLRARSLEVVRRVASRARGAFPVVGVGGVGGVDDAWAMLAAGASLVQVYTAFVYEGPTLAANLTRGLAARARREGLASIAELVGRELPSPPREEASP